MTRFGSTCWLVLVAGCAPTAGTEPPRSLPPEANVAVAPSALPEATPLATHADGRTEEAPPPAGDGKVISESKLAKVEAPAPGPIVLETPYRFRGRPLPKGDVAASTHDTELAVWNRGGSSRPELAAPSDFHPATRVILDTKVLSGKKSLGRLDANAILAQTRAQGYWPFRLCFEEGLRKGATKSGTSVIRFSIDSRGKVSYARKMRSDLPAEVATCIRKATYEPRYRPGPPRRVDVEVTAQLSPGDVALPDRDPESSPVTSEALRGALVALEPRIARCYADGLGRDPSLWGRVELRLFRDGTGTVMRVLELGSRFPDPAVRDCVASAVFGEVLPSTDETDLVVAWRLGERSPK